MLKHACILAIVIAALLGPDGSSATTIPTRSAVATDVTFQPTLTCFSREDSAFLVNTGTESLSVTEIIASDSDGQFIIQPPSLPLTLSSGDSLPLPVTFAPHKAGTATAQITIVVKTIDGAEEVGRYVSTLTGTGTIIEASAHIARDYTVFRGTVFTTPIMLDDSLDEARITGLAIRITYDAAVIDLHNSASNSIAKLVRGTLLDGWSITVAGLSNGELSVVFTAPPGTTLKGTGPLVCLTFQAFLNDGSESEHTVSDANSTPINFSITPVDRPCVTITSHAGHVNVLPKHRLSSPTITPNPIIGTSGLIMFTTDTTGPVTIEVFQSTGESIGTIVEGMSFVSGSHALGFSTFGWAPAEYYVMIRSNGTMVTYPLVVLR